LKVKRDLDQSVAASSVRMYWITGRRCSLADVDSVDD
jgi:hypothetical protein